MARSIGPTSRARRCSCRYPNPNPNPNPNPTTPTPTLPLTKVLVPLCGGNIDTTVLGRVIERGLAADGRLVRLVASVSDR